MIAETIFVGTELLLGNIVNTNAAYLAEQLAMLGFPSYYQTTVGDNAERLEGCIRQALERSELVILSGGLGPTQDDITKEAAARVMGRKLVLNETAKAQIEEYFAKKGKKMAENNLKQAMMPEGALMLENRNGTAPGVIMEENGKILILLPGPPEELSLMFEQSVLPYLQSKTSQVIYSVMVKVCGMSESDVAEQLDNLINRQGDVTVAPYAKIGEVHLRVTAKAQDEKQAKKLIKPVVKDIKARLGDAVYTTHDDTTLEKSVVDLLLANHLTVTTVESCTGGLLAGRLINVPGVSEIFKMGHITYSNKAKRKIVGVKRKTLEKYGAVSEQVVKEMVNGVLQITRADVAVSISGVAGPDGGTEEKPVGLVYIACGVCGVVTVQECHFSGNRKKIRDSAVAAALILMRRCILEYCSRITFEDK
ncbi:MAG: competence/damage-inducible protein A [Lachnospiraceae bacterium]|nr:competence/damage-inducible protein A [Lachnospiraceae bacterium]